MDRYLLVRGENSGRNSYRLALLLIPLAAAISIALAFGAGPLAILLYGSEVGVGVERPLVMLCPLVLLLAQAPILPLIGTSDLKHLVTVTSVALAGAMMCGLVWMSNSSLCTSAAIVSLATVAAGAVNFIVAARIVRALGNSRA
jgi:hypothetical protein